jgi:hypothetical protein
MSCQKQQNFDGFYAVFEYLTNIENSWNDFQMSNCRLAGILLVSCVNNNVRAYNTKCLDEFARPRNMRLQNALLKAYVRALSSNESGSRGVRRLVQGRKRNFCITHSSSARLRLTCTYR